MSNSETTTTKKGLGRGLSSLLGGPDIVETPAPKATIISKPMTNNNGAGAAAAGAPTVQAGFASQNINSNIPEETRIWSVAIEKLTANPRQPRKEFDADKLKELASSIKEKGILQPIVVRRTEKGFQIIAGERRWRAAQQAGLQEVPVILRKAADQEALELALIENIQRHDLNPIDEAEAYQQLADRFALTQDQIAQKVGKDRSTVTNSMRLLGLAPQVLEMVRSATLSTGHAKVLLSVADHQKQIELAKKVLNLRLSVRALESLVKTEKTEKPGDAARIGIDVSKKLVSNLSEELQKMIGTKVAIDYASGKGKVSIHFYSDEELNNIVEKMRKTWKN